MKLAPEGARGLGIT